MDVIGDWCQLKEAAGLGLRSLSVLLLEEAGGAEGQVRRSQMEKTPESEPDAKR